VHAPQIPLPWERLLWSGRSWRARYFLTDFRLVRLVGDQAEEVALHEITDVQRSQSRLELLTGTSTLVVHAAGSARGLALHGIRRGAQLAALLELLSSESAPSSLDAESVRAALEWEPRPRRRVYGETLGALALVALAVTAVATGFHARAAALTFSPDDPMMSVDGSRRPQAEIMRFMKEDVLPWARTALGPIKGGPDHVTCQTCHGTDAAARGWRMPAVAALPQPDLRDQGWEHYGGAMDAQMRNAIYGYLAESDKQAKAGYMREVVMPGMAGLLHRPPYDFTQPYEYNRSRQAFGCYHCHQVK
jgi:hypothetical protein